jgi:hypothetical protein
LRAVAVAVICHRRPALLHQVILEVVGVANPAGRSGVAVRIVGCP